MNHPWWKEAVVYQVYPRSFKDSNGDGIGDLAGVLQQLDYIQSLGVDAIWLNPIFGSPNEDGGYDISDYYDIHPDFGTLDDFDRLIGAMHQRGLRLIMDLVVNHSSDEHAWFQQSAATFDNPFRSYYFWRNGRNGGPPNNWPSFFGGSAWKKDERTGQYYLHLFSEKQPDLNWEHPVLRQEVHDLMRFWLKKGVDGLRLDVISAISKRTDFPDTDTKDFNETIRKYYANGPRLRAFISEMRHSVWDHFDVMTIGEGPGITPDNALQYLDAKDGLNMIFHFGHMFMDQGPGGRFDPVPWTLADFKKVFQTWDETFREQGWGSIFLGNHDFPRMVSRWGNAVQYREASSKLLCTLMMTMRGTPFVFQGDELGMTNTVLGRVDESQDVETLNGWRVAKETGMNEAEFLRRANYAGRDNARTPMQWDDSRHAGFTSGTPWMPVNPNYQRISYAAQEGKADSILQFWRDMIRIRKTHLALVHGAYQPVEMEGTRLFVYDRVGDQEKYRVVLNMSDESTKLPDSVTKDGARILIHNYPDRPGSMLRPWEAFVFHL